MQNELRITTN